MFISIKEVKSLAMTDLARGPRARRRGLSSLMDCWIRLVDVEANGERNRTLYVIKSRGMSHSNQVREYRVTDTGIELIQAYIGPEGMLTGTARLIWETREHAAAERRLRDLEQRKRQRLRGREALEREIAELQAKLQSDEDEQATLIEEEQARETKLASSRAIMAGFQSAAE